MLRAGFPVAGRMLHEAQQRRALATTGPYTYVQQPRDASFILIMRGFLFQWPTILTLAMFPVLAWMYVRLARQEERDTLATFGYMASVPALVPRLPAFGRDTSKAPDDPSSRNNSSIL